MGVYYDSDVSGSGSATLGGVAVIYVAVNVLTVPTLARGLVDPDEWIRAGWFALGDNFDVGLGAMDYWSEKVYIDFETQLWTPNPSADFSDNTSFQITRTRIRWQIGPGGLVHLHVFGF